MDLFPDVLIKVTERVEMGWSHGRSAGLLPQPRPELRVFEGSMPQSVWLMIMIAWVPSRWWEMIRDRTASSVAMPPAFRMMCASPVFRPRIGSTVSRASMQTRIAIFLRGGIGRSPD